MTVKTNPRGITFFKNQDSTIILRKIANNPNRNKESVYKVFLTKNRFHVVFNKAENALSFARGFNKARHTKDNLSTISPQKKSNLNDLSLQNIDPYVRGFTFASKLEYLILKLDSDDELLIRAEIL